MSRNKKKKLLKFDARMSTIENALEKVFERMGAKKWDYRRFGDGSVVIAWLIKDESGTEREYQVKSTKGERFKDNLRAAEQAITLVHRVYEMYQVEHSGGRASLSDMFLSFQALPCDSVLALPAPSVDPWEVLGLTRTATVSEVKSAYRKLSKQYHPDAGGNGDMFQKITKARDTILEMRGQ